MFFFGIMKYLLSTFKERGVDMFTFFLLITIGALGFLLKKQIEFKKECENSYIELANSSKNNQLAPFHITQLELFISLLNQMSSEVQEIKNIIIYPDIFQSQKNDASNISFGQKVFMDDKHINLSNMSDSKKLQMYSAIELNVVAKNSSGFTENCNKFNINAIALLYITVENWKVYENIEYILWKNILSYDLGFLKQQYSFENAISSTNKLKKIYVIGRNSQDFSSKVFPIDLQTVCNFLANNHRYKITSSENKNKILSLL